MNFFLSNSPAPIDNINGSESNSFAVALSDGSFLKHLPRKFRNSWERPETVSGGLLAIITIAIKGLILRYLGYPSHNYTNIMPRDQISTLSVYYYFFIN